MKKTSLVIFISLICSLTFAQVDLIKTDTNKSVYKGLKTKKYYQVRNSYSSANGKITYKLDGKEVDKSTYDKYDTFENMSTCTPCILMAYDMNERLISKSIQYTDCTVGFWIEYFPNGKAKVIGHYKENESGDLSELSEDWFCEEDGTFTYYNEQGEELYNEYWKNGQFLKQIPEQTKTELWDVELTYDSANIKNQILTPKQVSEIKITPKFKNSSTDGTNITIKFDISIIGHKPIVEIFTIENFNKIDVQKMLDNAEIKRSETPYYMISIYNNGVNVYNYMLKVKRKK